MAAMDWDPSSFEQAQRGVRVNRVSLEVELSTAGRLSCLGSISYHTGRGGTLFLLSPSLKLSEVKLDDYPLLSTRTGPLVRLSDSAGAHRLGVRYAGPLPSDGGLGISGTAFDLNINLLWYPTLTWGSRFDVELKIRPPPGSELFLPATARRVGDLVSIPSTIDVPLVGGKVLSSSQGAGVLVHSLVRDDVRGLKGVAEKAIEWLEGKWGVRPFAPVRLVETRRQKAGAYARPGLIVTPDWSHLPDRELSQRLIHEATHQWWGMDVLPGEAWFAEDWLSEGLATYCEFLWLRETEGPVAANEFSTKASKGVDGLRGSLSSTSPFSAEGWSLSRFGGLLALVALERRVPDLLRVLREFRTRHHGGFVTTRSLIRQLDRFVPGPWLNEHLLSSRSWPGDLQPANA